MDEQGKSQQHPPPSEPTPWEKFLEIAREELRWLLETLGLVTVTLTIGRLIQKLGLDVSTLTGSAWQEMVEKALRKKENKP